MNKTKIEWCDMTWNPVTGCLHGCEYCYARGIAKRFGKKADDYDDDRDTNELYYERVHYYKRVNSYPYLFRPTFHRYRLDEPQRIKKPQNIFVCSMADLFGEWVPDSWIDAVFEACEKAPWHRYLFLTKNARRYKKIELPRGDNFYFGSSVTNVLDEYFCGNSSYISCEPLQGDMDLVDKWFALYYLKWVIIGAETGNRKGKVIPKREWIESIVKQCQKYHVPVFMKNSLAPIWQGDLVQQLPWEGI